MKYLLVKDGCMGFTIYDRVRKEILTCKHGYFEDNTESCLKMYKSKSGQNKMGAKYYAYVLEEIDHKQALIFNNDIIIDTDDFSEVSKIMLDMQRKQLLFMLENNETSLNNWENGKQYYTYRYHTREV